MAETISIACSNCQKTFSVPATLKGKRIRCKSCGQSLAVEERATPAAARPAAKPKAADDEEWTAKLSGYGVTQEKVDVIRCPHCAGEIPDQSVVVCVECGYNLRTREKMDVKILEPATGADYFIWHLPAGICGLAFLFSLFVIIATWTEFLVMELDVFCFTFSSREGWGRAYLTVLLMFVMFFTGRYAFIRFFLNPHPPEREKRIKKDDA